MHPSDLTFQTCKKTYDTVQELGGVRPAARLLNIDRQSVKRHIAKYERMLAQGVEDAEPIFKGKSEPDEIVTLPLPPDGVVYNYILTSCQNNTIVDPKVMENLLALRDYYNAAMFVSRFTYNPNQFGKLSTKPGTDKKIKELEFDELIEGFECDYNVILAPGLQWCGSSNISPTSQNPLAGLESHTGRRSAIYPHPRLAMRSVASGKHEATKLLYTTGAISQINYVQKMAGQKAEHHHTLGALLVQVTSAGHWYVRQLNADRTGAIFDDEVYAYKGKVKPHAGLEAIVFGDTHAIRAAPEVLTMARDMINVLRPDKIVKHDILDFMSRSHHGMKNAFEMIEKHFNGSEDVTTELEITARVVNDNFVYPDVTTIIVNSNHDQHLERWLREADWKKDPVNAEIYLDLALQYVRAIKDKTPKFILAERALKQAGMDHRVVFLQVDPDKDEQHVLLKERSGGIEIGYHGDTGPNGARGNIRSFAKMGRKSIIGHSHAAGIEGGCYQVGTSSQLDLGYNTGPGAWTWTHCIVHANGKRQMITMYEGAWRGEGEHRAPIIPEQLRELPEFELAA